MFTSIWLGAVACVLGALMPTVAGQALSPRQVITKGQATTALVEVKVHGAIEVGAAVCIEPSGYFVTDNHVVRLATHGQRVYLILQSGSTKQKRLLAKVVARDENDDLAVLKTQLPGPFATVPLGTDIKLYDTQRVVTFGYPLSRTHSVGERAPNVSVSVGRITAKRYLANRLVGVQLGGSLNPGNSGGPVMNMHGQIIGIVAAVKPGDQTTIATPVDVLRAFLERPQISFNPPTITHASAGQPVIFQARVVSILHPKRQFRVRLVLQSNGTKRLLPIPKNPGVYRAKVHAFPMQPAAIAYHLIVSGPKGTVATQVGVIHVWKSAGSGAATAAGREAGSRRQVTALKPVKAGRAAVKAPSPGNPVRKLPVPRTAALTSANKLIQDVYGSQMLKATTAALRASLAGQLLAAAQQEPNPNNRYALLLTTLHWAELAGNIREADAAVTELNTRYDIDRLKLEEQAVRQVLMQARTQGQFRELAGGIGSLVNASVQAGRYHRAMELARMGLAAAKRSGDRILRAELDTQVQRTTWIESAYVGILPDLAQLKKDPGDAKASLAVGEFKCFDGGNWPGGLPLLARGSNPTFRALAIKELADPAAATQELALGDNWWRIARNQGDAVQLTIRQHAGVWYTKAEPSLSGLERALVADRLTLLAKKGQRYGGIKARPVIATSLLLAADDFVMNVYLDGKKVPSSDYSLLDENFGAAFLRVRVAVHAGDWLVFNVANDRFRWGGSCGLAVAGLYHGRSVFVSRAKSPRWRSCSKISHVPAFIAERRSYNGQPAVIPRVPYRWTWDSVNSKCDFKRGQVIWAGGNAANVWLKYRVPSYRKDQAGRN